MLLNLRLLTGLIGLHFYDGKVVGWDRLLMKVVYACNRFGKKCCFEDIESFPDRLEVRL